MSLQVSDLQLSADKLVQFANAQGDTSGTNALLQEICNAASEDVNRLTDGYVITANSFTNFARAIALFRAYGSVGPVPPDVEKNYTAAWAELESIAEGKRPNLAKDVSADQTINAGGIGGSHRVHGRMGRIPW
jgi:hypothetical protein